MTRGPAAKGPIERAQRRKAMEKRSRDKRKAKHALYMRAYRAANPGLSTPYVRAHRAKKAREI